MIGFWTKPRIETLCTMWERGARAAIIAETIGNGCTRNMVIGKANRCALTKRSAQDRGFMAQASRRAKNEQTACEVRA